jgi:hypothetical protein
MADDDIALFQRAGIIAKANNFRESCVLFEILNM